MKELKFVDSYFHGSLIKNIYLVLNNLNTMVFFLKNILIPNVTEKIF
jgi:hypothetical protein